jgi:Anti-sigma-K factor rskA/Putative zinc-finger
MKTGNGISGPHDCSGDAAAYVLGALDPPEAEAFRAHLAGCVICRDEVTALQQAADALSVAAPQYPVPRGLRRRVLAAVRAEPRMPDSPAPSRRSGLRIHGPALTGALAVVLAAVAVAVLLLVPGGSSGVRVVPAHVTAPAASAELRLASGRAELIVRHFPPPPGNHIYEVWLQRRGHSSPSPTTTLFSVTSSGAGNIGLTGSLSGVSEVLVTPEPAGGSLAPTHPPVIVAQLS